MQRIDRDFISRKFNDYVAVYCKDGDTKVLLKVEHTCRVAALSEQIAKSIGLHEACVDLAWLIGMLHDIGRFEQVRRYGTFEDARSVRHADLGVQILFEQQGINEYLADIKGKERELKIIRDAIAYHSAYRLPDDLDEETRCFCDILRDADKIDIMKVVVEKDPVDIYGITYEELKKQHFTDEVLKCFDEGHAVLRSLRKSPLDNLVSYASFVYELVYPESRRILKEQGYIWELLAFQAEDERVNRQLRDMEGKLRKVL